MRVADRLDPLPLGRIHQRLPPLSGLGWLFGVLRRTAVLRALWFALAFPYYGSFIWLPTLLVGRGFPEVQSFRFTLIITLAQIPG